MTQPAPAQGLMASLRRLMGTVLDIAQVRLEILGTELELEKRRLFDGLLWGAAALLLLVLGLVLLCGFVVLLFWEGYRLAAVGVMAVLFLSAGGWLLLQARRLLRSPSGMFQASLGELQRDQVSLRGPGAQTQAQPQAPGQGAAQALAPTSSPKPPKNAGAGDAQP